MNAKKLLEIYRFLRTLGYGVKNARICAVGNTARNWEIMHRHLEKYNGYWKFQ